MELIDISKINTKTVAFDFFDTVVHRDCHPEEILYQWSKQMAFEMKFEIYPSILYDLRKNVEKTYKNSGIEEIEYYTLLSSIYKPFFIVYSCVGTVFFFGNECTARI